MAKTIQEKEAAVREGETTDMMVIEYALIGVMVASVAAIIGLAIISVKKS